MRRRIPAGCLSWGGWRDSSLRTGCRHYLREELAEVAPGGGFTGANMDRPALTKLLRAVEAGELDFQSAAMGTWALTKGAALQGEGEKVDPSVAGDDVLGTCDATAARLERGTLPEYWPI